MTPPRHGDGRVVLQIEDLDVDHEALRRALHRTRPDLTLVRCTDGADARAWFTALADDDPLPALVVLDLTMPHGDGREFLAWFLTWFRAPFPRGMPPVVVLSSSTDPDDVHACYVAGASGYVAKPVNHVLFQAAVRGALDYWVPPRA